MSKDLKKIKPATYLLPKEGGMRVPGLVIASEKLLEIDDLEEPLKQVRNVAYLPGILGYSVAMPDIHWGYGFPIGGVAATDAEEGVISPGGVGYDINCGVRLALIDIPFDSITAKNRKALLESIYKNVPSGVGKGHSKAKTLTNSDYEQLVKEGAKWSIDLGYGFSRDLEYMESYGVISGGDAHYISTSAKDRGRDQLGSIGSGNHFVEIGKVDAIFLKEVAKEWEVFEGQTYVLIHSGSRGLGHQVCQDTLDEFVRKGYSENLPDKQLVSAPIKSEDGKAYFKAMAAAANFAFNNRQRILHEVRQSFNETLGIPFEEVRLLYDVCHNIAKFETHLIDGVEKKVCVHRKGATRSLGPKSKELNSLFQKTGQPVLVPGDMARASFLLVGLGNPLTFCSCCHGAGREMSRFKSSKFWKGKDPIRYMEDQGVQVKASSIRTIVEEMPNAYKDGSLVVQAVEEANLAKQVARLKPFLVVKG